MRSLFVFIIFLFSTAGAHASYQACLNARSNPNNFKGGHAFVTITRNGRTLNTYGYYPVRPTAWSETAEIRTINQWMGRDWLITKYGSNYRQVRFCHTISEQAYQARNYFVDWFMEHHPVYDKAFSNCATFARFLYTNLTRDSVNTQNNPGQIIRLIDQAHQQGAAHLSDIR